MLDSIPLNLTLWQCKSMGEPPASLDPKRTFNMAILELSEGFSPSKEASFEMTTSIFEFINMDPEMRLANV